MGISISRNVDLSANEYLLKFADKENISPNDPFWNRFLAFNIKPPTSSTDQLSLDTKIEPICQKLLVNNLQSGNIGSLIRVFLTRCGELLGATNTNDNVYCWQIFNSLFTIRCILKYLTETVTEEQLIEHLEVGADNQTSRLESLIGALFGIIVDIPLKEFTYAVHLEAITCLIVFLSVQLHTNKKADQSSIYRLLMKGRQSIHAPLFMKSLINNFIEQRKAPPSFSTNQSHSIVLGLASELWSILTLSRKDNEEIESSVSGDIHEVPLATQSLLLVLILTNHYTTQTNPYRQCLFACLNSQDNNPIPPTKAPSIFKIDYSALFITLCKRANGDAATLLLYLLLHRNTSFKSHLLARLDLDQLVIPVLKTLYHAPDSNSHHIYMSLIILLILSEDDTFNRSVHETVKGYLEPFKRNGAFQDIVQNIYIVIEYFSQIIQTKSQQNEVDATQVLSIIQQGTKQWPKDKLTKFPELKFKYVEEDQPEEFFIPYVWALVSQQSMLHWSTEGAAILTASC
ncbi:dymeclin [Holotrichia oblita]|uniref:Dymeclin n=1 Tax=Holotrichia oblita TaxID=644536 RepID=A0ACB9TJS9_HOLOL|nr:dymeclin [Holotrichia oblita]